MVKAYGDTTALAGVDLAVGAGETVALMGPSGSGKTTLALCAAGLVTPDRGQVWLGGERLDEASDETRSALRLRRIGIVFQAGHLLGDLTAEENAALPLMFSGIGRRQAVAEVRRWFAPAGLSGLERRRPGELSGGQAQRVAIIRAVAPRPELLVADEPTAALDRAASTAMMQLLTWFAAEVGATLIVVTHDPQVAGACRRRVEIVDGCITDDQWQVGR